MYKLNDRILVKSNFNNNLFYDTRIEQVEDAYVVVRETCMDSERLIKIPVTQIVGIFNGEVLSPP